MFGFFNIITQCSENDKSVASFSLIYNLLLLKGSDIANSSYTYDPPLWYITHLILFLPLIIILMVKNEKIYKYFLCWFIPIMLYALCMDYMKKIAIWEGGIFQCFRGIAGLTVSDPGNNCITSTMLEACTCSNAAFFIEEELLSLFPAVAVTVTSFNARVCSSNFRMYFSIFLLRLIFIS